MIRLPEGLTELPGIDLRVDPVVELGMAQEDEVVDGDDAPDAALADADGQFARESVKHLDTVALQIAHDPLRTPQSFAEGQMRRGGVAEPHVLLQPDLLPEMIPALIGCIETQLQRITRQIVHQGTSVTPQSCAVAHDALGVESYLQSVCHERLKCLKTNLTSTKFVGTAMASTARGASSRLSPIQRKKLKSTICNR